MTDTQTQQNQEIKNALTEAAILALNSGNLPDGYRALSLAAKVE